ncbi:hypothetical protein [Mycolicibacterium houstonense]|uniref:hypothetical protein n=1 Tax=Mycolicibacterium houstonense TaxID=146021 RepID=UPI00082C7CC8|nr:hypothetical protein [Mycolicibacterium houstonense]
MASRKKKKNRKVVMRRSVTGIGVFATATVGLLGQAGTAVAAPPKYAEDVSAYSHAIDNAVVGATQATEAFNSFWAPLAADAHGLLPSFSASSQKVDMTDISKFPEVVRAVAQMPMPTAVPGVVPQVNIPGQGFATLPVPTSLPGADMLVGVADGLDAIFNVPGVEWIVGSVPPLSELIPGLEATQRTYHSGFEWPVLGIGGATSVSNTYVHTPGSPSITANLPVAQGIYRLPLDAAAGWWASAPTLAVSDQSSPSDLVVSLPMGAVGLQAPGGLGQAGVFGVSAVLPSANGLYVPVGATISNMALPGLGFGATNLNLTTGNYVGADGINLNNGQNMLVIQTPLTGPVPVPVVYSLGGFTLGPSGVGYTAPSLYGVSLISPVQVGSAPTGSGSVGFIPADLIPVGDIMPTQLISVSGLASAVLGVRDPAVAVGQGLTPIYDAVISPAAQQVSNLSTQQYGSMVDALASATLQASQRFKELTDRLGGTNAATTQSLQTETASVARDSGPAAAPMSSELTSTRVAPAPNAQQMPTHEVVAAKDTTTTPEATTTKADSRPARKLDRSAGPAAAHGGVKTDRERVRGNDGPRDGIKAAVNGAVNGAAEKLKKKVGTSAPMKKPAAGKKSSSGAAGGGSSSSTSTSSGSTSSPRGASAD